jgi:glutathione S-transferase
MCDSQQTSAETTLTLFQAEWCPFSSAVREVLTELGIDFVARHVEPWPRDRAGLRALAGTDQIPVLQTEDGSFYRGTREIFALLRERQPGRFAAAHRRRVADHQDARVSLTGQLNRVLPRNRRARGVRPHGRRCGGRRRPASSSWRPATARADDMTGEDIHDRIEQLVAEEHELYDRGGEGAVSRWRNKAGR